MFEREKERGTIFPSLTALLRVVTKTEGGRFWGEHPLQPREHHLHLEESA